MLLLTRQGLINLFQRSGGVSVEYWCFWILKSIVAEFNTEERNIECNSIIGGLILGWIEKGVRAEWTQKQKSTHT